MNMHKNARLTPRGRSSLSRAMCIVSDEHPEGGGAHGSLMLRHNPEERKLIVSMQRS